MYTIAGEDKTGRAAGVILVDEWACQALLPACRFRRRSEATCRWLEHPCRGPRSRGQLTKHRCNNSRSSPRRCGQLSTARPLDLSLSDWPAIKSRRSISARLARAPTPRTVIPGPGAPLSHSRRKQRRGRAPARAAGRAGDDLPDTLPSTRSRFWKLSVDSSRRRGRRQADEPRQRRRRRRRTAVGWLKSAATQSPLFHPPPTEGV